MEKELEKLQRQLAMAIKERRYARMAELQRKIAALQNVREHVPLSFLLPKFTPQERDKALVLMHQVFVFADMLYGAALEFEEYLKGFDRSVTLPVVVRAKKAAAECRDITRYVDSFGDERMSALFGEMCDEISLNAQMLFIVMSARKQKNRNHEKKDVIMGDKTHTALPQGGSVHTAVALRAGRQGAAEQALPSFRTYTCIAR